MALRRLEAKGLLDEQGLVEKVRIQGDEDEFRSRAGEGMQRKQRLQSGNAAADDDGARISVNRRLAFGGPRFGPRVPADFGDAR